MSEPCNCGRPACVDCNTGWIQATLREAEANFRTTETNAANNAQNAIRDIEAAKSRLAEQMNTGFTAQALAASSTQLLVQGETAKIRLEQAQAELRASERAAAYAAAAAAAACKTDALIAAEACKTNALVACEANRTNALVEGCCCKTNAAISAQADRLAALIHGVSAHATEERFEHLQGQVAAYFAAKVPPVIP